MWSQMYLSMLSVSVMFLFVCYDTSYGKVVGCQAKATDDSEAGTRDIRVVAELLTLMDIGDMNLHTWALQAANAILQGNARVRIGSCIEDYTIV